MKHIPTSRSMALAIPIGSSTFSAPLYAAAGYKTGSGRTLSAAGFIPDKSKTSSYLQHRSNSDSYTEQHYCTVHSDIDPERTLTYILDGAASLLGLTALELRQYLQDGDSIQHMAEHQGLAATQFSEQLLEHISMTLKEAEASGQITQRQYGEYLQIAAQQIQRLIDIR
ncbi:hypothetical protein [Paenibacillus wulumuqiensis]|uniref:hypothetical protein n=1 Tax=Paenibacillus wulumuqiensis TaxID=1567107 RepID=UPI000619D7CA|nr:hypothetical protein [Paenibacillus wulumuqiensis]